jgi:hypothetical protein
VSTVRIDTNGYRWFCIDLASVQMLLLEPSAENPLNMEAYSYYITQSDTFEQMVQRTIVGDCTIAGVKFSSVRLSERNTVPNHQSSGAIQSSPEMTAKMSSPAVAQSLHRPPTPFSFERNVSVDDGLTDMANTPSGGVTMGGRVDPERGGCNLASAMEDCDHYPFRATVFDRPPALSSSSGEERVAVLGKKRHLDRSESEMELDMLTRREYPAVANAFPGTNT